MRAATPFALGYAGVSTVVAFVLGGLLLAANPGPPSLYALGELVLSLLVIAFATNAVFGVVLLPLGWLARRLSRRAAAAQPAVQWISGLIGANLLWHLWHRLAMAHQWLSVRPFISWTGLAYNVALLLIGAAILAAGTALGSRPPRLLRGALGIVAAALLTAASLAWNARDESYHRRLSLQNARDTLGRVSDRDAGLSETPAVERVILLGIDGLCWSVALPLMEAGELPALADLFGRSAVGYLDNDDESLSPVIWTSVYTGRSPDAHGILGFRKLVLRRSGWALRDLLKIEPTIDNFYGLRYLLSVLEPLGLWELSYVGSPDRRVAAVWEVLSRDDRRVVVVNPLASSPVRPVNGAMVLLSARPGPNTMFPGTLAERWQPTRTADRSARNEASLADLSRSLDEQTAFALQLMSRFEPQLGIFYTHLVDTFTHMNWDFHARGRFLLRDLPWARDDAEWKKLLLAHRDDLLVKSYQSADRAVAAFLAAQPGATFFLVSDHGWTFSGYEHFGSPPGVLLISGPSVRSGVVTGAHVNDIAPTLLAALGAPLSRELEGRVLEEAFRGLPAPSYVPSYPAPDDLGGDGRAGFPREEVERLRALGYVR